MKNTLTSLPSVNDVVEAVLLRASESRALIVLRAREVIEAHRAGIMAGAMQRMGKAETLAQIAGDVTAALAPGLRRVINATGVVLHTGLGRAPLADEAIAALVAAARFCNVQADLDEGMRSLREAHTESLLCHLTGCEAATIVNNNAGATLVTLAAIAKGREVIVSRGELVEIGGSYRIPEVMAQSGAVLVEVGCTNRTHLRDYEAAITEQTVAIMKVHTSNYAIQGFTSSVSLEELSPLASTRDLILVHDMGSGSLIDFAAHGLGGEPPAGLSIQQGAHVVTFSGDKLVGGPQAGLIIGSRALIERIRSHPLARALRVDKLVLASLEATLRLMLDPQEAVSRIPALRMITAQNSDLQPRAKRLALRLRRRYHLETRVSPGASRAGSGAFPVLDLPTTLIEVDPGPLGATEAARRLRQGSPSVFVRITNDRLIVDVRTVFPEEERDLAAALGEVAGGSSRALEDAAPQPRMEIQD
ncbi:L-seryl-tRNA(Sec) selenium transferase [Candidatus Fermentibacteria bacterium]|nr:L-seryl-tRNA(Sec) selenium transferase [Candidatus Fermentibacteria bacterium]